MMTRVIEQASKTSAAPGWILDTRLRDRFRQVLDRLEWSERGRPRPLRTLGVTSCHGEEGVSTVAIHLALVAAGWRAGKVLLVDANVSEPTLSRSFGAASAAGLAEALAGEPPGELLRDTAIERLAILPAGQFRGRPVAVYQSPAMGDVAAWCSSQFDFTIVDLPPASTPDCLDVMAGILDGILLVIEADRVHEATARRIKETIARANGRLVGVVLNKSGKLGEEAMCPAPPECSPELTLR